MLEIFFRMSFSVGDIPFSISSFWQFWSASCIAALIIMQINEVSCLVSSKILAALISLSCFRSFLSGSLPTLEIGSNKSLSLNLLSSFWEYNSIKFLSAILFICIAFSIDFIIEETIHSICGICIASWRYVTLDNFPKNAAAA